MCSISVTPQCVGTDIFIYGIQWRRRLTKNYIIIRKKKRRPFRCIPVQMEDNMKTVSSAVNFVSPAFNEIHLLLTGVDSAYVRLLM